MDLKQAVIPSVEPEPEISSAVILRSIAGIRPFREGGVRIEYEMIQGKRVIHNYGHGGAGVTLSWGSAEEVVRLAKQHASGSRSACVIGAGVIGLTSAVLLSDAGLKVRICSELFTPRTTSDVAGAQWSPSLVDIGEGRDKKELFSRLLRGSLAKFKSLVDKPYGISVRPNYVEEDHDSSFYKIPEGVLPPMQELDRLPFPSNPTRGRVFTTLFIEPPVFLPELMQDCLDRGVKMETRKLADCDELSRLPEDLVIHCTGMGAKTLVDDTKMIPLRGQLVLLKPQRLPWLLSHRSGYIFPRNDAVVLGGTVERGENEVKNTEEGTASILKGNRDFFRIRS